MVETTHNILVTTKQQLVMLATTFKC